MTQRFWETSGTVEAEDSTVIQLTVQHVAGITPERARELFDMGENIGDWGWKHKLWFTTEEEIEEVRAAARFFYGWGPNSEAQSVREDGTITFEAWYAA